MRTCSLSRAGSTPPATLGALSRVGCWVVKGVTVLVCAGVRNPTHQESSKERLGGVLDELPGIAFGSQLAPLPS